MSQSKYELVECIGSGGMATVYRARHRGMYGFERTVALKRIASERNGDPAFVEMFIREAKILSALSHPNIVHVYDFGCDHRGHFIAMELLEGRTVGDLLKISTERGVDVPIEVVYAVARQLADALAHVHERCDSDGRSCEIVHRDISPANLLITRSGHLKLIDFGVASSRAVPWPRNRLAGKLSYMAPELFTGAPASQSTDLFATGVLLWQLLAGRTLFAGPDDAATIANVQYRAIPRPASVRSDCPPALDTIIMMALERDPARRLRSAAALRDEITRALRDRAAADEPRLLLRWLTTLEAPAHHTTEQTIDRSAVVSAPPVSITSAREHRDRRGWAVSFGVAAGIVAAWFAVGPQHEEAVAAAPRPEPPATPRVAVDPVASPRAPVSAVATSDVTAAIEERSLGEAAKPKTIKNPNARSRSRRPSLRPLPHDEPKIEEPTAPPQAIARDLGQLAPTVEAPSLAPAPRTAPITIAPDRVRQTAGAVPALDLRRIDREGVERRIVALLCIDKGGATTNVRYLTRIPEWIARELTPALYRFTFTPYVSGDTGVAACFTRELAITGR